MSTAKAGNTPKKPRGLTYSEKHGLEVPQETAKFIGLEVAEVQERKVASTFQFHAQVFRAASEVQFASAQAAVSSTALATALLSTNDAARMKSGTEVKVQSADGKPLNGRISEVPPVGGRMNGHVEAIVAVHDPGISSNAAKLFRSIFWPARSAQ